MEIEIFSPNSTTCSILCSIPAVCCIGIPALLCEEVGRYFQPKIQYWKAQRRSIKQAPKLLSLNRKRNMTLPLPVASGWATLCKKQKTDGQIQSTFFRLPAEIREIVYLNYFTGAEGDCVISILAAKRRLAHICWRGPHWDYERSGKRPWPQPCGNHSDAGLLALPLTCREVYSEAINFLYSSSTFLFHAPEDILSFTKSILPHRLDTITSLEIVWNAYMPNIIHGTHIRNDPAISLKAWNDTWTVIAKISGLKRLSVKIKGLNHFESPISPIKILGPVAKIARLEEVFEVVLPADEIGRWEWVVEEAWPFDLVITTIPFE